jgi:hypothetical protein
VSRCDHTRPGPLYWFDEHNFANYWKHAFAARPAATAGASRNLSAGGEARVAFVCCAFDDHHANGRGGGCTVKWTAAANGTRRIIRACLDVAAFAWDGSGGTCKAVNASSRNLDSEACGRMPRHAAPADLARACSLSPSSSFGFDVAWLGGETTHRGHPGRRAETSGGFHDSSAWVIGAGDSITALLKETRGQACGVPVVRTVAAFHAAKSKHASTGTGAGSLPGGAFVGDLLNAGSSVELHPRFLHAVEQ